MTVKINLRGTFGYGRPVKYYGPGEAEVPEGLARALGKMPVEEQPSVGYVQGEPIDGLPSASPWPFLASDQAQALATAGYTTQADVDAASDEALLALPSIGVATIRKLRHVLR